MIFILLDVEWDVEQNVRFLMRMDYDFAILSVGVDYHFTEEWIIILQFSREEWIIILRRSGLSFYNSVGIPLLSRQEIFPLF